tara:strand:- start:15 stop:383 length:369 start_codon:yes stop_codon:yes gene_type:complete
MITALIGPIANVITGMMKNSSEKSQAKQKLAVAKIEAQVSRVQQDGDWEAKAMSASDGSWKDEAWTIAFIALIAACMWPPAQPFIKQGFIVLKEDCPEFISWGILASIGASFGLKSIGAFKK